MTYPYINVPQSLVSLETETIMDSGTLRKARSDFLKIVRLELKASLMVERAQLLFSRSSGTSYTPICAICEKPVPTPSMHEVIVTRGRAQGWRYEKYMQIFVPWNVSLVHEGECHRHAQFVLDGKKKCIYEISKYYTRDAVLDWLHILEAFDEQRLINNIEGWSKT